MVRIRITPPAGGASESVDARLETSQLTALTSGFKRGAMVELTDGKVAFPIDPDDLGYLLKHLIKEPAVARAHAAAIHSARQAGEAAERDQELERAWRKANPPRQFPARPYSHNAYGF